MLSDSLRTMRREFQNSVLEAGECVQISLAHMQAFIIALEGYEVAAKEMEVVLWPQPMAIPQTKNGQRFACPPQVKFQKLTVIQGGISTDQ
ncbi:hypothetical protein [Paenochrobactrum glaciei]|uniref:Uncharacterized protein n=1 Tax=Paenochrobactrum glaciei TaxID=486407 RepID=A0ABN1FY92_9HYPH